MKCSTDSGRQKQQGHLSVEDTALSKAVYRYVGSENKIDETKYNYKKTDWERFKRILEAHLAEEVNEDVIMTAIG